MQFNRWHLPYFQQVAAELMNTALSILICCCAHQFTESVRCVLYFSLSKEPPARVNSGILQSGNWWPFTFLSKRWRVGLALCFGSLSCWRVSPVCSSWADECKLHPSFHQLWLQSLCRCSSNTPKTPEIHLQAAQQGWCVFHQRPCGLLFKHSIYGLTTNPQFSASLSEFEISMSFSWLSSAAFSHSFHCFPRDSGSSSPGWNVQELSRAKKLIFYLNTGANYNQTITGVEMYP